MRRGRFGVIALAVGLAAAVAVAGLLAARGGSGEDQAEATPDTSPSLGRPTASVDRLVSVGGARLHLECRGAGDATVLLLAGFGGSADDWDGVAPPIAATSRVCAYDRFGTGQSDPAPRAQTFATQAEDLYTLLSAAGEVGPYVVVGHSFGGAEAVTFTSRHREEVTGVLLLDASPPTWNAVLCGVEDDGSATAGSFRDLCASQSAPANNQEHLAAPAAFDEVARIASLGDVPLIVATAPVRGGVAELGPSVVAGLNAAWDAGQAHWASLSTSGRVVTVPDTGHYIQHDQPDVVIDLVGELVRS